MNLDFDGGPPLVELRQAMRFALSHEPPDCVSDVELLVTELVANAYEHGRAPTTIQVWRVAKPSVVRIEVGDGNRHELPVVGISRLGSERGRGMTLVKALSGQWGVYLHQAGKTVWAEVSCRSLQLVPDNAV
ncbi:MAG: ATP-binding protein [Umezawaea sp.]